VTALTAGTTVSVQYIGTLDNGRIFGSRTAEDPLAFTIGAGEVFPALEQIVMGMKVGEVRNVVIPAAEAYGPRSQDNIISIRKVHLPAGKEITVGQKLSLQLGLNTERVMVVSGVSDTAVTLDGNHPLAGHDLTFALRLDAVY
jgi:peptidylprolyl isomerase